MEVMEPNTYSLMLEAKNGNSEAFGKLYNELYTPLFRYIVFRTKNKDIAEDILQDVFLKVFQRIDQYKEENAAPLSYFYRVARNAIIDYYRKKETQNISLEEHEIDTPDKALSAREEFELSEKQSIFLEVIEELPDNYREALEMRFISGLTTKEIARSMSKSEDAVRQLQSRGLKLVRQHSKVQRYHV